MSQSDSVIPLSIVDGTLTAYDGGANSAVFPFIQTEWNWTRELAPFVEARTRNKHHGTPVLRKTGDGNITGAFTALVATLYGLLAPSLEEILGFTNGASGWATTSAGDRKTLRIALIGNASAAGGATQTYTFNYCAFSNIKVEPGGADGLWMISADFTDHEENFTRA